jgi:hypothetical protein
MKDGSKIRKDTHLVDESHPVVRVKLKNHLLDVGNRLEDPLLDVGKRLVGNLLEGNLLEGNLLEDPLLEGNLLGEGRLVRNAREQRLEEKFATLKLEDGSKRMVL